ncbi:ROP interactive partner 3 isoform 2 [Hibiscus syriacus]|uniref:ROP interactive partner 3 isoform 2 n=1 Tax=Hibiscus syriacus TaxID=106335 RepID=A0A6A3C4C9_HIBSY|nr:ROP interactive partner 3 isoform 2 [Hibiscus syriacus]
MPKERSPKVTEHKVLRTPISEKSRSSRVTELEAQLDQFRADLEKKKDQLTACESWKGLALKEAEEAKKQLSTMSTKLEESEQQLLEISAFEDDRVQELHKIPQNRDRAWQSELEAVQKQHSMDSAALASAMTEIQKLKFQLEKAYESEAIQIKNAESGHSEIMPTKETEAYNTLLLELEQSKGRVKSLEGLVSKLQVELVGNGSVKDHEVNKHQRNKENEDIHQLKSELNFAKLEISQLRSTLDAADVRETELEAELKRTKADIEELRSNKNEGLDMKIEKNQYNKRESEHAVELKKLGVDLIELRDNLTAKETELKTVTVQNKMLEMEIERREMESNKVSDESSALLEAARAAERAPWMKLEYLNRRAARVNEELDAAQAAKAEMEAELSRLKVQRRACLLIDTNYKPRIGWEDMSDNDDDDDDSSKKKNGTMLRKIGALWKKGQK